MRDQTKNALFSTQTEVEIPFYDVDSMDITWHGHYIKYFENARCALLESIGHNYQQMADSGYSWPVVSLEVKYIRPTVFLQKILVEASLIEYEMRLKIHYRITDKTTGEKLILGQTTQVAIDRATQELCYQSPRLFTEKVQQKLAESKDK